MSQENVAVVRRVYEAFASGDIPSVLGAFDERIEWREADNHPYADGNPYVGPEAVLRGVFARIAEEWDGFAATPEDVLDAGDTAVAYGHYTGTFKPTGRSVRAQFAHLFTLRGGKVVRFQQYTDTAQFQRAASVGGDAS
jgi:ketosteroid isomerase-like protein